MGLLQRVVATVRAVTPEDWHGKAGRLFRRGTRKVAELSHSYQLKEKAEEVGSLGWQRVQGEAWEKHHKAMLDEAQAELLRIQTELDRRTLEARAREAEAKADKAELEVELTDAQITKRKAESFRTLVETLQHVGVGFQIGPDFSIDILPVPVGDLDAKRVESAGAQVAEEPTDATPPDLSPKGDDLEGPSRPPNK